MGFGFGFGNNEMNVQPIYGCPVTTTTPYNPHEQALQDTKLRKIKDILTVTEFEKLDIMRILRLNKEGLNEYIQLLIKVRDSGAYDEPEGSKTNITPEDLDMIFTGAGEAIAKESADKKNTLSSDKYGILSHPDDQPYIVINDHPVSLTSEGDEK